MGLREYRRKRNFSKTPEPSGNGRQRRGHLYVIQKHAATRLHYDFRLEMDGVLKSWAVPKGPSLDPAEKRLAVEVEDHPLEYGKFEGTIPEGEYGGGTVMLWDYGKWQPLGDGSEGYREGKLKFILDGKKLRGGWTLVRMRGGWQRSGGKPNWLLIKERDEFARPLAKGDILEEESLSAKTRRTMDEIASAARTKRNTWSTNRTDEPKAGRATSTNGTAGSKKKAQAAATPKRSTASATRPSSASKSRAKPHGRTKKAPKKSKPAIDPGEVAGARRAKYPGHPQAQLATLVSKPPEGHEWFHEIKFDGYRMLCCIRQGNVQFISRNAQDWTHRMQPLVQPVLGLELLDAVLDGEVVVLDKHGVSSFQLLQNAFRGDKGSPLVYFVFDLLYLEGYDFMPARLEDRKAVLENLLKQNPAISRSIRLSDHVVGSGALFKKKMCEAGLEGMISKRRDAQYAPGRSASWLKSKCRLEQEFVIGGYSRPSGSRINFGALLVGYYRPDHKLAYAGRVGTGFNDTLLRDLMHRLTPLRMPKSPFADIPRGTRLGDVNWVKPELVAQVEFSNWTDESIVRQAAFKGLREDKPAREVRREIPK